MEEEDRGVFEHMPTDEELLKMMCKDNQNVSAEEKLNDEFSYLLFNIPMMLPIIKDAKEKSLCEEWLDKLVGALYQTNEGKRCRNLYLMNLLLNMSSGKLEAPFTKSPPNKLENASYVFDGREPVEVCYNNNELEVEDFAEYSKDGRTFFASKALPGGNGAFGYLGLSVGGGDATWLDCKGDYVDPSKLTKKSTSLDTTKENKEQTENLRDILSKRSPKKERSDLVPYYYGLLEKIEEITKQYGTAEEKYDPVIEKMLEELQMDIIHEGKIEISDIGCYVKEKWLAALKNKIQKKLQAAEEREATLNNLESMLSGEEKTAVQFLDVSNAVKPLKLDPVLAEAARDRPSQYNVDSLHKNYPLCVVKLFLRLLEKEKIHVINQELIVFQDFITHIRAEVLNEARRGLSNYIQARKELRRVKRVLKDLDETKNRVFKEMEDVSSPNDPDFREKDHLINSEIDAGKLRLEEAEAQSDIIEKKIARVHRQVHQLTDEFESIEEDGKEDMEMLLKSISDLQGILDAQQRKTSMLQNKIDEAAKRQC